MRLNHSTLTTVVLVSSFGMAACSPPAPRTGANTTRAARGNSTFSKSNPSTSKARLSEVQSAYARVAYTHDDLGRETKQSVVQRIGGAYTFESRYGYSGAPGAQGAGNVLVSRTVPGGDVVRYAYDAAAQRKSVHYGNRTILASETRDGSGRVVERRLGDGSVTTIAYHDNTKLPRTIFASKNGSTILNLSYAYDARQNPERIEDAAAGTMIYRYDSRNQLVAATGARGDHRYAYDAIGNLVGVDGRVMSYDGEQPHAPTSFRGSSFGYDANGNRVTDLREADQARTQEIHWTVDNRVAAITRDGSTALEKAYAGDRLWLKIEYGPNGARNTTEYLPNLRVENARLREQFDGLGERLPNGEYRFFHTDHLGSLRAITNGDGQVVAQYAYEPYGAQIVLAGTFDRAHGYNGHEHDSSDYINYGARDFDPFTARWLSPDTADKDGLNRYAYVRNNPIRYFDANGNESDACGSWCQFQRGRADAQWDTPSAMQGIWHSYYGERSTKNSWETGSNAWKWGYSVHQTAGVVAEAGWSFLLAFGGGKMHANSQQQAYNRMHYAATTNTSFNQGPIGPGLDRYPQSRLDSLQRHLAPLAAKHGYRVEVASGARGGRALDVLANPNTQGMFMVDPNSKTVFVVYRGEPSRINTHHELWHFFDWARNPTEYMNKTTLQREGFVHLRLSNGRYWNSYDEAGRANQEAYIRYHMVSQALGLDTH